MGSPAGEKSAAAGPWPSISPPDRPATRAPDVQAAIHFALEFADEGERVIRHDGDDWVGVRLEGAGHHVLARCAYGLVIPEQLTLPDVFTEEEREQLVTAAVDRVVAAEQRARPEK